MYAPWFPVMVRCGGLQECPHPPCGVGWAVATVGDEVVDDDPSPRPWGNRHHGSRDPIYLCEDILSYVYI